MYLCLLVHCNNCTHFTACTADFFFVGLSSLPHPDMVSKENQEVTDIVIKQNQISFQAFYMAC